MAPLKISGAIFYIRFYSKLNRIGGRSP